MIYLDYSATTPINDEVLDTFVKVSKGFVGNPNSLHKLGVDAKRLIDASTNQVAEILNVLPKEVIYTSGSTEANNLAIKGYCLKHQNRGKHIITTRLEHSSVTASFSYLQKLGFDVSFIDLDSNGMVTVEELKKVIRDDTILVSICSVNSEIGLVQDIEKIGSFLKDYPKIAFHSDMTQSIGKIKINLENVDLVSFSAQKFFGPKGVGCLIKKESISLEPQISGGKSTTVFRSGTPAPALIASLSKALRLTSENINENYEYVSKLNKYLRKQIDDIEGIVINSNSYCSPYILNISIKNIKSEVMLHALEQEDIYISTQTACSKGDVSPALLAFTNNYEYAKASLRISLSYLTTKEELDEFVKVFKLKMKELDF